MNEKHNNFIELTKKYEKLHEELKEINKLLLLEMKELGENSYLQDPNTLVVYKIVKPNGHYVFYKELDYERTIMKDEKRGSLSKKEAESKGFSFIREDLYE